MKRDLQRWLRKTHVTSVYTSWGLGGCVSSFEPRTSEDMPPSFRLRRVLTALDDVLGSQESPLDVKEPWPGFPAQHLDRRAARREDGETLATHCFYSLLMDDASSAYCIHCILHCIFHFHDYDCHEPLCCPGSRRIRWQVGSGFSSEGLFCPLPSALCPALSSCAPAVCSLRLNSEGSRRPAP